MPVAVGSTPVTAIYHGSTLIADLRHASQQITIGSGATVPDAPTNVGVTVSDLSAPDAPTGVGVVSSDQYDDLYDDVVLLLQDSLTDESPQGQTVAAIGDAAISTTLAKVGTSSFSFDGNGDYLDIANDPAFEFGTGGDFTIEAWVYLEGYTDSGGHSILGASTNGGIMLASLNGDLRIGRNLVAWDHTVSGVLTAQTWHHVAVSRSSGTLKMFVDGAEVLSAANSISYGLAGGTLFLGARKGASVAVANFWHGYLDAIRLTSAARYTTNFTPPTAAFPTSAPPPEYDDNYDDVVLLLQDSLTDESPAGRTITYNGTAGLSTDSKVGTHSISSPAGGANYVSMASSADFGFGTGDLTLECWFKYPNAINVAADLIMLFDFRPAGSAYTYPVPALYINAAELIYYVNGGKRITTTRPSANTWHHVAVCRISGTTEMFLNGVSQGTWADSTNYTSPSVLRLGRNESGTASGAMFIDSVRVTKGVGRYATAFTPPTDAFPTSAPPPNEDQFFYSTSLLLQDSLLDESPQGQAVIASGAAGISTAQVKVGTHSLAVPSVNDYFEVAGDSSLDFGTGDFTVECWLHMTGGNANQRNFLDFRGRNGGNVSGRLVIYRSISGLNVWDGTDRINGSAAVPDNQWLHIACTRESGHLRLFLDGTLYGENSNHTTALVCDSIVFGGTNSTLGMTGYFDGIRITKGVARYTTTFTPPTAAFPTAGPVDEAYGDVALLLRDSTSDESPQGQTITVTGTAAPSTTQSKFGGVSFLTNGSSNSLTVANDPAFAMPADFTIESWIYFDTYSASEAFAIWEPVNHSLGTFNSNRLMFLVYQDKLYTDVYGSVQAQSSPLGFTAGQWYHVAASRQGSTLRLFLNGTQVASATTTRSFVADEYRLPQSRSTAREMYFDDLRVTVGTVRYTADFTPPTATHPATNGDIRFGSVSLLLQDSLADESPQGQTLTIAGNTAVSTVESKFGGSSISFDGSGDWITAAADPSLVFGTSPFTVEFWMYWDGTITGTPYMGVMGAHNANTTGRYGIFMTASGIGHYIQSQFPALSAVPANQWVHIASTRDSSGTCRFFIDGALKTTVTDTGNLTAPQGFRVGNDLSTARPPFSGYIDSLRITTGHARYTAAFTPPTAPFPS